LLGGTLDEINCGVSIGLKTATPRCSEIEKEVAAGYQRIKIKINRDAITR